MSKAGKGDSVDTGAVGSQHPVPEDIPHLTSPSQPNNNGQHPQHPPHGQPAHLHLQPPQNAQANMTGGSPVKEASHLHRETSAEEAEKEKAENKDGEIPADQDQSQAGADAQAIPRR